MLDGIVFTSFSEFLQMGRYAFHVWTVYILFTIFVVVNLTLPGIQRRQFIREQKRRAQRDTQTRTSENSTASSTENTGSTGAPGESV
ncbi:MAG: heme exporter protein CcmD [Gammaproteobacteria bacterium RIFCSPLOWO2_02_FULL_57_10]|nr:MAG: heme exporter protein CcmD [Gammaproteobacteria bacterium RIFCSPLOWO2_02_FULL_57_10]